MKSREHMSNKLLLVTGGEGQVGKEYQLAPPKEGWEFVFLSKSDLDVTDEIAVEKTFNSFRPDACLNLAAFTDISRAEALELKRAYAVNVRGAGNVAKACSKFDVPLIHISTEYVFDTGNFLYTEQDIPKPISYYGKTKLLGEVAVETYCNWSYIIRTSWLYSNHSKNLYTKALNLAQERNRVGVSPLVVGCPTSAAELCRAIDAVLDNLDRSLSGLYHFSCRGRASEKGFVEEIYQMAKIAVQVSDETILAKSKLKPFTVLLDTAFFTRTFGYVPKHWKNALFEVLAERKHLPIKVGDIVFFENEEHLVVSTDWIKKVARIAMINNMNDSLEVNFKDLETYGKQH